MGGRHALRGVVAGARASWRVMRAAFPEKDDRDDRRSRREPEEEVDVDGDAEREAIQIHPVQADAYDEADDDRAGARGRAAVGDGRDAGADGGAGERRRPRRRGAQRVREGRRSRARRDGGDRRRGRRRRALRARGAGGRRGARPRTICRRSACSRRRPRPPSDAPIIVEPASIARFRQQEAADAAAAAELSAEDAARLRDEKRGFIKLGDGDFRLPGTDLLEYIPPANQRHRQAAALRHGRAARAGDVELRRARQGEGDPHGSRRHHVRVRARAGHAHGQDRQPREGSGDGAGGAGRPHRRPDPGQGGGRRRGAEQDARDGLPEGDPRGQQLRRRDVEAAGRARQGHQGRAGQREPVEDAAPAGRRDDRLGQVGRRQRDDHQPALQRVARRRPLHHGRPEDARAVDLRGHPAPVAAGRHRSRRRRTWRCAGRSTRWSGATSCSPRPACATSPATTPRSTGADERQEGGRGGGRGAPFREEDPRRRSPARTAPSRRSISTPTRRSRSPTARAIRPASSATRRRATRICPTPRRRRRRPRRSRPKRSRPSCPTSSSSSTSSPT